MEHKFTEATVTRTLGAWTPEPGKFYPILRRNKKSLTLLVTMNGIVTAPYDAIGETR